MVMACNIVVATKRSKFGLPEGWYGKDGCHGI